MNKRFTEMSYVLALGQSEDPGRRESSRNHLTVKQKDRTRGMLAEQVFRGILSTAWKHRCMTEDGERTLDHGSNDSPPPMTSLNLHTLLCPRPPNRDNKTICSAPERAAVGITRGCHCDSMQSVTAHGSLREFVPRAALFSQRRRL